MIDTSGVGTHMIFRVTAAEDHGTNPASTVMCTFCVEVPEDPGCTGRKSGSNNGFDCAAGFPELELTCPYPV